MTTHSHRAGIDSN